MMRAISLALALLVAACGGDGSPPAIDADPNAPDAEICGATPLYEACTIDDDCRSCLCFSYNMGGMLCTKPCSSDADCPAPSTGCSGMGVCKRPQ